MAYVTHNYNTANGKATSLTLTVNMAFFDDITTDNLDGYSKTTKTNSDGTNPQRR